MPQNVPQCPAPANDHDTLSTAPSPQKDPAPTSATPPDPSLASSRLLPDDARPPTTPDSPPLTARQLLAIDFLVLGHSETAVAEALRIDRKTLYRWRRDDPRYRETLEDRRKELLDATADRFRHMLTTALDTFDRHLTDPYAPTAHRAARSLLALAAIGRYQYPSLPSDPAPVGEGQPPAAAAHTKGSPSTPTASDH